jgi:hypothetical protein
MISAAEKTRFHLLRRLHHLGLKAEIVSGGEQGHHPLAEVDNVSSGVRIGYRRQSCRGTIHPGLGALQPPKRYRGNLHVFLIGAG